MATGHTCFPNRVGHDQGLLEEEEEEESTSQLDLGSETSETTANETDGFSGQNTNCSHWSTIVEQNRCQNRAKYGEQRQAQWDFKHPKSKGCQLAFALFRDLPKEEGISYQDWHSEI